MSPKPSPDFVPALAYHWLTPFYDSIVGATTRERVFKQALIEQAGVASGQQVLDLACGSGTLSIWLKQKHPATGVTGVDADSAILALARKKADRAGLRIGFDEAMSDALPYASGAFDRVVCSLFFHHLQWPAKQRTAREIFRVLKPGGELHVADWGVARNVLMRLLYRGTIQILDGYGNTLDNAQGRLVPLFEQAGFSEVAVHQTFDTIYGTMALYRAVRLA